MSSKQKMDLFRSVKEKQPDPAPPSLVEVPEKSCRAPGKNGNAAQFENMLIHGDNLLVLKALEQDFSGRIKCIYIDPPYNTGSAFTHYDDCLQHSVWLDSMRKRLKILHKLLADEGFFCCHIDDSESSYLKVILDEIFGYRNFLSTIYVKVRYENKTLTRDMIFHKEIEQIHVYRKTSKAKPFQDMAARTDEKYCCYFTELAAGTEISLGGKKVIIFRKGEYEIRKGIPSAGGRKEIWASGSILEKNSSGRFFRDHLSGRSSADGLGALYKVYGIGEERSGYRYFTGPCRQKAVRGKYYQGIPISPKADDPEEASPIPNFYDFAAQFGNCSHEGGVSFRSGKKPELLLQTILKHFSSPGDWVLDSFLGSGTTAAAAHKMGRRWIGIESAEQCNTHCLVRLKRVVDGSDQTGISRLANWQGGGGYRFFELAGSPLTKDKGSPEFVSKSSNAANQTQAAGNIGGSVYAPGEKSAPEGDKKNTPLPVDTSQQDQ